MKYAFLVCLLLSLGLRSLQAQEYEVCLQLDNYDPRNLDTDLHPFSDYERKPGDVLLPYLVKKHRNGEIDLYTSKDLSKKIPIDSLEFYTNIPAYEKLDSVYRFYYDREERAVLSFIWGHLWEVDETSSDYSTYDSSFDDGFDSVEETDSLNTEEYISIWTGWDFLYVYQNYDLFLYENWSVAGDSLNISHAGFKITLISADNGDYYADSVGIGEFYLAQKDLAKIPIDLIYRKKWGAIQEENLPLAFSNRNFPCEIFSIRNGEELLYKKYLLDRMSKSSFLEGIKYEDYLAQQGTRKVGPARQSISSFILQLDKEIEEDIRNHESYDSPSDTINYGFFEGNLFRDLIQYCINGNIPIYGVLPWERESRVVYTDLRLYFFEQKNYGTDCKVIYDAQQDSFRHSRFWHLEKEIDGQENFWAEFDYKHADTIPIKDLPEIIPENFMESIHVEGTLIKEENQVSFQPEWIYFHYGEESSFRINMDDLRSPHVTYDGKRLNDYLTSLSYYSYPVYVNNPIIRDYSEAMYLKELLFMGRWEEIHQESIDPASCSVPPQIARLY